jgi:site-specific DNA-methyltransferase (adenine-specific)
MTVELIQGDCLDYMRSMPDCSVDTILTDPPYAIMGGGASIAGKGIEDVFDTQFYEAWFKELAIEFYRILKPTGAMWWTTDWRGVLAAERAFIKIGKWQQKIRLAGVGIWDRGGLGMGYVLRKTYECFAVAVMPEWKRIKTDIPDVWRFQWTPGDRKNGHSAEKPVYLFKKAIELLGGEIFFDPFMGSGSSAVACIEMDKSFIGVEREEDYFAIAQERIRVAQMQPGLFNS